VESVMVLLLFEKTAGFRVELAVATEKFRVEEVLVAGELMLLA